MIELNYNTIIAESLKTAFGLETYTKIINEAKDPSKISCDEFRKMYNGYYKLRQMPHQWYDKYYELMAEQADKNRTFKELLEIMYETGKRIEVSFVSKLMATINPKFPIWDKYVLKNLGMTKEWERLAGQPYQKRIELAATIYNNIIEQYELFINSHNGNLCIDIFNEVLPDYKNISDVKKIDFMLWSKR